LDSEKLDSNTKDIVERLPFGGKKIYNTNFFTGDYDLILYSVLMDYDQELYKHKRTGVLVPYGSYVDITDLKNPLDYINRVGVDVFNKEFLDRFKKEFDYIGQISPKEFVKNLITIREKINPGTKILFLNGSEIISNTELEPDAYMRHKEMNDALEQFISQNENCYLLDVRKVVDSELKVTSNIRHYTRECYFELSKILISWLEDNFSSSMRHSTMLYYRTIAIKKINKILGKYFSFSKP
jgi:hypothetical protein